MAIWEADKQRAKDQLHELRKEAKGEDYWKTWDARERFLTICAIGGEWCYEAALKGLYLIAHNAANTWQVWNRYDIQDPNTPAYTLHLWVRPRFTDSLRQHLATACDAELHDGWDTRVWMTKRKRTRKGRVIYRGTVSACLEHAKMLFASWDAVWRLGGKPYQVVFL